MARDVKIKFKTEADTKELERAKKETEELNKEFGISQTNFGKLNQQAKQSGAALDGVKNQVAPLGEAFSSMGSAINLVNPQMGMMVQGAGMLTNGMKGLLAAMKTIITSPIALAIIAATAAFTYLKKELDKANAVVKELVAGLGSVPGVAERNAQVKRSYDEMARSIENVNDKLAHERELEDMVIANGRAQAAVNQEWHKQRELAGATTEQEKQEIEDRYARVGIETIARQRSEDINRNAERTYSDADAENYAKMREQSQSEIAAQEANIAAIKGQLETNQMVANGEIKTGTKWWNFYAGKDTGVVDEDDRKAAAQNVKDLIEQMKEAEAALAAMEANAAKNEREESQAKEKRAQILRELTVVEAEAKAQQEALNTQIKQREKAEAKARAEAERGVADILNDDAKQGAEWQWGRDYDKADTETKKEMLDAKIKRAQAEASRAKKEMEDAAKGDPNDEETKRRLADAQRRFTENQGMARSAQSSLDALNEQKGGVTGFKLSDRLSAMGGFATAGAKAVSGIFANSKEERALKEAEKQTKQGEAIKTSVQNIEQNTRGRTGVFA